MSMNPRYECPVRKTTLRDGQIRALCCRGPLEGHSCQEPNKKVFRCKWLEEVLLHKFMVKGPNEFTPPLVIEATSAKVAQLYYELRHSLTEDDETEVVPVTLIKVTPGYKLSADAELGTVTIRELLGFFKHFPITALEDLDVLTLNLMRNQSGFTVPEGIKVISRNDENSRIKYEVRPKDRELATRFVVTVNHDGTLNYFWDTLRGDNRIEDAELWVELLQVAISLVKGEISLV